MSDIFVSIIIPTLNRENILIQTINYINNQLYKNYEIIIIDQSDIPIKKDALPKSNNVEITLLHSEIKSLPNARNIGAKIAKGDILLFVDDDVIIEKEDFIEQHAKNYCNPEIGAVAGRVVQPWNKPDENPRKVGYISRYLLIVKGNFNCKKKQFIDGLPGGNFSVRKSIFNEVKGFDKNYIGTALREETDFALKIRKKGYKIIFEPQAELIHLAYKVGGVRNNNKNIEDSFYWYYHNNIYFFNKHGNKALYIIYILYLLINGIYHAIKYRDIKCLTNCCIKGIIDGHIYSKEVLYE